MFITNLNSWLNIPHKQCYTGNIYTQAHSTFKLLTRRRRRKTNATKHILHHKIVKQEQHTIIIRLLISQTASFMHNTYHNAGLC